MSLREDIYYFCKRHKRSCTMEKIRRYCSVNSCPNLGQRKKKKLKKSARNSITVLNYNSFDKENTLEPC